MWCFVSSEVTRRVSFYQYSSILVFVILTSGGSSPTNRISKRSTPVYDDVLTYLSTYGYLPHSDLETGNLRTDDQLKNAIRSLQRFGNIPVTGIFDSKTKELLHRPRCGIPDLQSTQYNRRKKRYALQGQKWRTTNLTWSLQSKNVPQLDPGRVRYTLHKALDVWAKYSKLTFKEVSSDNADILVYFERGYHGDGFPFDGRGQVLAHAFFPAPGRGGDAHFDEQELWILDNEENFVEGTSLFAVAAHEFGHSLGLSHSSVSGALMYPWYQGLKANFELPDDDREAIQRLYEVKDKDRNDEYPVTTPERPTYIPRKYFPAETPKYNPPYRIPSSPSSPMPPRRIPTYTTPNFEEVPNTCDTSYDAISVIRNELFIFKGKYFWRIGDKGLYMGYPTLIKNMWNKLPQNFTHVDAVYERFDRKIIFFIGREIYVFDAHTLISGYPKPLTSLGLPSSLDNIDAVMVWGHNNKTYFFSGTMYWRLDDEVGNVELDYPRDMSIWRGIDYNIDAAFQWKDGITYFFKGKGFWKFDDARMRVANERLTPSAHVWMGCPKKLESRPNSDQHYNEVNFRDKNISESAYFTISQYIVIICVIIFIVSILVCILIIMIKKRKTHSYLRAQRMRT